MNQMSASLSAYDLAGITRVVSSLVSDESTATSVAYATNGGGRVYDPGSGTTSYSDSATSLTGWLSPLTLEHAARVDGVQLGDVQLLVTFSDLATEPATDDRFTVGTAQYRVYRVVRGPLDTHWCVYAHLAS